MEVKSSSRRKYFEQPIQLKIISIDEAIDEGLTTLLKGSKLISIYTDEDSIVDVMTDYVGQSVQIVGYKKDLADWSLLLKFPENPFAENFHWTLSMISPKDRDYLIAMIRIHEELI